MVSNIFAELYWRFFSNLSKPLAVFFGAVIIGMLQLLNVATIILLLQDILSLKLVSFIWEQPYVMISVITVITGVDIVLCISRSRKLQENMGDDFFTPMIVPYSIITILLFIAMFLINHTVSSSIPGL